MQIKRLLDDRLVVTGDKLINSPGEHCEFADHADGQLVAVSPDGEKVRYSPAELGCYLLSKDRTDRELAKDRLRDFEKTHRRARLPSVLPPSCISHLSPIYKSELG